MNSFMSQNHLILAALLLTCVPGTLQVNLSFGDSNSNSTGDCVPRGGGVGECRELFSCPPVVKTFRRVTPVICGFNGVAPIVCCPKPLDSRVSPASPNPVSKPVISIPKKPSSITFDCGRRGGDPNRPFRGDVVGGEEASPNSWPWMVALGRFDGGAQPTWFCDGSLISPRYVLTAGHCIAFSKVDVVRLGEHNLQQDDVKPLDMRVTNKIFHPGYHPPAVVHDLALLRLSSRVNFTPKISPVCLPWVESEAPDLVGRKLTVTGWGAVSYGGPMSDVLREVVVTVFPSERCETPYSSLRDFKRRFPGGFGNTNFVCAGDRNGGKDACEGDSGGPLMYNVYGRYVIGGIVSTGHGCGQSRFPGVYAAVAPDLQWIKEVVFDPNH